MHSRSKLLSVVLFLAALLLARPVGAEVAGLTYDGTCVAGVCTVPAPPSVAAHHVEIATILNLSTANSYFYSPPGWKPVGPPIQCAAAAFAMASYYRVEDATDTSSSTYTFGGPNNTLHYAVTDYAGLDYRNPIAAYAPASAIGCSAAPVTSPSGVTPTASNQEVLYVVGGNGVTESQNDLATGASIDHGVARIVHFYSVTPGNGAAQSYSFAGGNIAQTIILNDSGTGGVLFRGVNNNRAGSEGVLHQPATAQSGDEEWLFAWDNNGLPGCPTGWTSVQTGTYNGTWRQQECRLTGAVSAGSAINMGGGFGWGYVVDLYNATQDAFTFKTCSATATCATGTVTTTAALDQVFNFCASNGGGNNLSMSTGPQIPLPASSDTGGGWGLQAAAGVTTADTCFQSNGAASENWGVQTLSVSPTVQPNSISATPPTVNNATTCDTGTGATSVTCTAPTGSTGDLLLAPIYVTGNPALADLSGSNGFVLTALETDTPFGQPGPKADTAFVGLGPIQQMMASTISQAASGTAAETLEGWARVPWGWTGGGGLVGLDQNQNGTSDTWDRQLKLNNSCQWMYRHAGTIIKSSHSYCDGQWHYVVGTYDGTNMRLYVDAVLDAGPTANAVAETVTGYWDIGYVKAGGDGGTFYGGPFIFGEVAIYSSALSQARVTAHYTAVAASYDSTVAADTPTYFWKLNETTGGYATDSAGTNTGIYTNVVAELNQMALTGNSGNEPYFGGSFLTGVGAHMTGQTQLTLNQAGDVSIEGWFKIPNGYIGGGPLALFDTAKDGSNGGATLTMMNVLYVGDDNKVRYSPNANTACTVTSASTYNDGNWHHAVATFHNGTGATLYVDGSSQGTANSGCPASGTMTGYWVFGTGNLDAQPWPAAPGTPNSGAGGPNAGAFNGWLGRISVYSTVLNSTQVSNHYTHRNDGTYDSVIAADSPTSYWKMIETSHYVATDAVGTNTGNYYFFDGESGWAIFTKARTVSEPASYTFQLGPSQLAAGAVVDITGAKNQVDNNAPFAQANLDIPFAASPTTFGNISTDNEGMAVGLFGWNSSATSTTPTVGPYAKAAEDNDVNGVGVWIGTTPFDTTQTFGGNMVLSAAPGIILGDEAVFPAGNPVNPTVNGDFFPEF